LTVSESSGRQLGYTVVMGAVDWRFVARKQPTVGQEWESGGETFTDADRPPQQKRVRLTQ
jgi:hypothetical protein